jgi:predicted aspartyl protease
VKWVALSLLYASMLFLVPPGNGQEISSRSKPVSTGSLPFDLRGGFLIVIDGRIGAMENLRFILDTGASHTVISRRIADQVSAAREQGAVIDFQRRVPIEWERFPDVQFGPVAATNMRMMVGDLRRYSEFAYDIDAIVGLDLLSKCERVQIDYEAQVVRLEKCGGVSQARHSESNGLSILATLQNQPMHLLVDTGFQGIAVFEQRLRARMRRVNVEDRVPAQVGSLAGEEVRLPGLRVGHTEANTRVLLVRGDVGAVPEAIDGYLGPRALHAKRIEIDFASMIFRWQ